MRTEYTAVVLFGGIGGASLGLMQARGEALGKVGRFRLLCSIDVDPDACRFHDEITGEKTAVRMDLFDRQQYLDWHGHEPPAGWREAEPWDLWRAFRETVPDFLFTSPPCKGFSGLLPERSAKSRKYQALNMLTIRGLRLALDACRDYGGDLPAFVQLENVPRITTRGQSILREIEKLLKSYGYAVSMRADHNLGEIGGLGQNRLRFLILARYEKRVPNFCYYPPRKPMKTIGDVIEPLPMPDDPAGGPMHRLPRLQWKTWVRLALIPAGGDWRDLNRMDWQNYRIVHEPRGGAYAVEDWNQPSRTVTGTAGPGRSNGAAAVADPRIGLDMNGHAAIYRVSKYDESAPCVTGAHRPNNGAIVVADPRVRTELMQDSYGVQRWDGPSKTIRGNSRIMQSASSVADPRMGCSPRSGTMGVLRWDEPAKTVIGAGDIHAGAAAVADPRMPADTESGVWVILAEDGTWHRPLTTYELAMLQGFPTHLPDGRPFQLDNCSDAKAREYIGNAVPPTAMAAMGNVILSTMMLAEAGAGFELSWNEVWVRPEEEQLPAVVQ